MQRAAALAAERIRAGSDPVSCACRRAAHRPTAGRRFWGSALAGGSRPGCPASREIGGTSKVCSALAPLTSARLAAPFGRLAALRFGLRSRPWPLAPSGPLASARLPSASGGSRSAVGARGGFPALPSAPGPLGLSAGCLRPSARRRGSPGGSRCGAPGSGGRRLRCAVRCVALLGGFGPGGSGRLPRLSGALRSCRRPACSPLSSRRFPFPAARWAARLPPWAAAPPPSGGGWGGCAAPLRRRRPLRF